MDTHPATRPCTKAATTAVSPFTIAATAPVQLGVLSLRISALRFLAEDKSEVCSVMRIKTVEAYGSLQEVNRKPRHEISDRSEPVTT